MNKFFNVQDNMQQTLLSVNSQLLSMNKEQLENVISRFGLLPVNEYVHKVNNKEDITGFIRYIDAYLLEASGGKRSRLIQVGTKIMGTKPKAYSNRLVRLEILDYLLFNHS